MMPLPDLPPEPTVEARRALHVLETLHRHAIVSATDAAGRITFANDLFCRISGYSREELIGQNHRILKSGVHPQEVYEDMWRTIVRGETWHGDVCNRNKAGGFYWVRATITPFMNERGKPEEYISVRTEITAQKRLELASRHQELRLRTILDNLGEGIYTLDARGCLTYLNAEAQRLLGWCFEELAGKPLHDVIHHHRADGGALAATECPVHLAIRDNRIYRSSDEVYFHKDGTAIPVKMTGAPLTLEGEHLGSVAVFSDMREERLLHQRLLQAKAEAEDAARLKADFLSTMSHEIRTPLNGVIGMTDLLLDTPLDNEQTEFARIIKTSADALLGIVNDILDFSKIEAGRLVLEHTDFSLADLLAGSVDVVAARAREKELRLTSTIAADVPDHLTGDPNRIRQILLNFLSNAIKFTASGEVRVNATAGPVEADAGGERVMLQLAVRDSGLGLGDDAIAGLFQPFHQADSSTTRKYGGTGLGLSICKRLVDAMGGEIDVVSSPGAGSTFSVRLPLHLGSNAPEPAAAAPHAIAPVAASGLPLLLAEDNPVNQRVAVHMLNRLGHGVDVVDNGALAVAAVASRDYALLLLDCQMPEMDGYAAARAIRRAEAGGARHLPIVAMTANAQQGDRDKCLAAGMDDYIAKPVDSPRLAAVLAAWLPQAAATAETAATNLAPAAKIADSAAADGGPPAIDLQRLSHLFGAEQAVIDELLTVFQQSLRQLRVRLGREMSVPGHELRGIAHELRGTASNIGALHLAGLAGQLESLAVQGRGAGARSLATDVERELIRADDFVTRYLAHRKA